MSGGSRMWQSASTMREFDMRAVSFGKPDVRVSLGVASGRRYGAGGELAGVPGDGVGGGGVDRLAQRTGDDRDRRLRGARRSRPRPVRGRAVAMPSASERLPHVALEQLDVARRGVARERVRPRSNSSSITASGTPSRVHRRAELEEAGVDVDLVVADSTCRRRASRSGRSAPGRRRARETARSSSARVHAPPGRPRRRARARRRAARRGRGRTPRCRRARGSRRARSPAPGDRRRAAAGRGAPSS